jgi:hypothetical protein
MISIRSSRTPFNVLTLSRGKGYVHPNLGTLARHVTIDYKWRV